MFRIFRTTGNAHRPPPPFLFFLIIINAFIFERILDYISFDLQLEHVSNVTDHFLFLNEACWAPPLGALEVVDG